VTIPSFEKPRDPEEALKSLEMMQNDPVEFYRKVLENIGFDHPLVYVEPHTGVAVQLNIAELHANLLSAGPDVGLALLPRRETGQRAMHDAMLAAVKHLTEQQAHLTEYQTLVTNQLGYVPSHQPLRGRFVHMHKRSHRRKHPIWNPEWT